MADSAVRPSTLGIQGFADVKVGGCGEGGGLRGGSPHVSLLAVCYHERQSAVGGVSITLLSHLFKTDNRHFQVLTQ